MSRAWLVERKRDSFERVRADGVAITYGGVLVLSNNGLEDPVCIYAPGSWLTVVEDTDHLDREAASA